jgi:hypothetical protein
MNVGRPKKGQQHVAEVIPNAGQARDKVAAKFEAAASEGVKYNPPQGGPA